MLTPPKFPRTMSDAQFYGIAILFSLIVAAPVAVLSMFIASPFAN